MDEKIIDEFIKRRAYKAAKRREKGLKEYLIGYALLIILTTAIDLLGNKAVGNELSTMVVKVVILAKLSVVVTLVVVLLVVANRVFTNYKYNK